MLLGQPIREHYYKTLGTSVMNSPLSPLSLWVDWYHLTELIDLSIEQTQLDSIVLSNHYWELKDNRR